VTRPFRDCLTRDAAATRRLAARFVRRLPPGSVVALHGDLGAGKTTFVQGMAAGLGIRQPVTSPTFALVSEYRGPLGRLVHMDLFRVRNPDEMLEIGLAEHLESGAIVAVEWPERAGEFLPAGAISIRLSLVPGRRGRHIRIFETQHKI
jgi:tRNA threonylcarbamoyladenosine biosynthesis protein TsaE